MTITLTPKEAMELLSVIHGAIDDADGDRTTVRTLAAVEDKIRTARAKQSKAA